MRTRLRVLPALALCMALAFGLAACGGGGGGGTNSYGIAGEVSGLKGKGLVLQNNGGDDLFITTDGKFKFATVVADGSDYAVTVLTQPTEPTQICTVKYGTGTVAGADVMDVTVTCGDAYSVGGEVRGLKDKDLVLQNNGGDDLFITTDGKFTFANAVADGADYAVTVLMQPPGQVCTLTNSSGTVSGADVTDVIVDCTQVLVSAFYNANGADWNDYVKNDGTDVLTASDTACEQTKDGPGYGACLHGGEMREVEVTGKSSCTGLTASDGLGAFDWTCDDSTGTARLVSTGLKDAKNLSDLLNFSGPAWKPNSVTVYDGGAEYLNTSPAAWWANPVGDAGDGTTPLGAAGTIYVVTDTADLAGAITIDASKVALVAAPDAIINSPGAGSSVVSSTGRAFLWVEGTVDAGGDERGVNLTGVRFSVLRDLTVQNADTGAAPGGVGILSSSNNMLSGVTASNNGSFGVTLGSSSSNNTLSGVTASNNGSFGVYLYFSSNNNTLSGVTASNNSYGVFISQSSGNTLSGVTASNNGQSGVYFNLSSDNTLSGVTASNNGDNGVHGVQSSNNTLSGVTASNNGQSGVYLYFSSNNNTLSGVTATNNGNQGFYLYQSSDNTLSGVTAANNGAAGVYDSGVCLTESSNNTFSGVTASNNNSGILLFFGYHNTFSGLTASDNSQSGVYFNASSVNNYFTGPLKVGNQSMDCFAVATAGGLDGFTCANNGSSDAVLTNGVSVTVASSFVGDVTSDDTANASDTDGAATYPADATLFDWSNFENSYRAWGNDGGIFPSATNRDQWTSETGWIWDWSMNSSDSVIVGSLSYPDTGGIANTLTHLWYAADAAACSAIDGATWGNVCDLPGYVTEADCLAVDGDWLTPKCYSVFLRNAVEIQGDSIGNDNTLCENDEDCLYTPNIGSYQGHGGLVNSVPAFTDGAAITGVTLKEYETNGY